MWIHHFDLRLTDKELTLLKEFANTEFTVEFKLEPDPRDECGELLQRIMKQVLLTAKNYNEGSMQ